MSLLFFIGYTGTLYAHPHVFIDVRADISVDTSGLQEVKIEWIMEEQMGEPITDSNKQNYTYLFRSWLDKTITYRNYHIKIYLDGKRLKKVKVRLFRIKLDKEKQQIHLFFKLKLPKNIPCHRVVDLSVLDSGYYIAFSWLKDKVTFSKDKMVVQDIQLTNDDQVLRFTMISPAKTVVSSQSILPTPPVPVPTVPQQGWIKRPFIKIQVALNRRIHTYLKPLKENFTWSIFFLLFGVSCVYGIFHATGPGHGKTLMLAYFLEPNRKAIAVPRIAGLITLIHTGTAFFLVGIFYFLLGFIRPDYRQIVQSYISFGLALVIVAVGGLMAIHLFYNKRESKEQNR